MASKTFNPDDIQEFAEIDLYKYLALKRDTFTPLKAKSQFKKFILKYHPDRNREDPNAAKKFRLIEASYRILSNPASKAHYDKIYDDAQVEDDFEDIKNVDRSLFTKKTALTKNDYEEHKAKMRQKNLDLDPTYYDRANTGKMSEQEITNLMKERQDVIIDEDLQKKFESDMNILGEIKDKDEKQRKFNQMFETGRKATSDSVAIQPYDAGKNIGRSTALATVHQTETMFSAEDNFNEAFELQNNVLDEDEDEDYEGNFEDYERRYLAQLQDDGEMSKLAMRSTLKNGRADYTFDQH